MRRACARGCRIFDFGRSKQGTGSLRLQEELGLRADAAALRVQAVRATRCRTTIRSIPKYQLLIKMWQKLPLALANFLGPHIVAQPGLTPWKTCFTGRTGFRTRPTRATRSAPTTCSSTWRSATGCTWAPSSTTRTTGSTCDAVKALCAGSHFASAGHPLPARVRSLAALLRNRPLALDYYRDAGLARWVDSAHGRARHRARAGVLVADGAVRRAGAAMRAA